MSYLYGILENTQELKHVMDYNKSMGCIYCEICDSRLSHKSSNKGKFITHFAHTDRLDSDKCSAYTI